MTDDSIEMQGHAKVNLGLDVVGRLPNGYHEVKMVMQTVGVHDTVTLRKIPEGIKFSTENGEIPCDDTNLAYRAAKLFLESTGVKDGVEIQLIKRIPVAAGLAGGSTDAAAVFKGMNILYKTGLSEEALKELGVKIGADVPYCIMGGTALAEGIGEKLTPLPDVPEAAVLLAKPDLFVSTKEVYGRLNLSEETKHPDIDGMVDAIRERKSARGNRQNGKCTSGCDVAVLSGYRQTDRADGRKRSGESHDERQRTHRFRDI